MKLWNLTTRNIGLDMAYIYGVRGDYSDTEVVAAETAREKGVCLCKQETHVEDSSSTIVRADIELSSN